MNGRMLGRRIVFVAVCVLLVAGAAVALGRPHVDQARTDRAWPSDPLPRDRVIGDILAPVTPDVPPTGASVPTTAGDAVPTTPAGVAPDRPAPSGSTAGPGALGHADADDHPAPVAGTSPPSGVPASPPSPVPTQPAFPAPPGPSVRIVGPAPGSALAIYDDIEIEAVGVQPGQEVWIIVRFIGYRESFPQGFCDPDRDAVYWCRHAQFGDPETPTGAPFEVSAVIVTEQDAERYRPVYVHGFDSDHPPVGPLSVSPPVGFTRAGP
jgi:hypothetical protein